jgi:lipoate-protein ligase B
VIATLQEFGVSGQADPSAIGVWVNDGGEMAKVCALGVRIRRGVSLHGLALNVENDLSYFNLIVPCGLNGRKVTSLRKLLGDAGPRIENVREALMRKFQARFDQL